MEGHFFCNKNICKLDKLVESKENIRGGTLLKITFGKPMTMYPGPDIHVFWLGCQCHPQIKDVYGCQQGEPSKIKYSSDLHWISMPTEQDQKIHKKI